MQGEDVRRCGVSGGVGTQDYMGFRCHGEEIAAFSWSIMGEGRSEVESVMFVSSTITSHASICFVVRLL